ncbi:hypothetical protein SAMN02745243_02713 [Hespellia stercorisuis DSM 15480]|uniref:Uncharacterized protein n=1 Tax=Hespellia stercorisuis DSM 15480 TaxID=1121950 RepID=A0A1M6RI72_9FIRM|nr:hypothetical protein SAMN02745243_02713 [Hespellia stercorisuis DSM 15480]
MKRKIIIIVLTLCLLTGIYCYTKLPEYHITNSMSTSNQDSRNTQLKVIVYKYFKINNTIQKIKSEHNRINGTPTTLKINLYYPKWFLRDSSN